MAWNFWSRSARAAIRRRCCCSPARPISKESFARRSNRGPIFAASCFALPKSRTRWSACWQHRNRARPRPSSSCSDIRQNRALAAMSRWRARTVCPGRGSSTRTKDEDEHDFLSRGPSGARVQKSLQISRHFLAEARDGGELFDGGQAHPLDGAEFLQQGGFAASADSREFIEDAFGNSLQPKLGVVSVGEAMRFIAHALEQ